MLSILKGFPDLSGQSPEPLAWPRSCPCSEQGTRSLCTRDPQDLHHLAVLSQSLKFTPIKHSAPLLKQNKKKQTPRRSASTDPPAPSRSFWPRGGLCIASAPLGAVPQASSVSPCPPTCAALLSPLPSPGRSLRGSRGRGPRPGPAAASPARRRRQRQPSADGAAPSAPIASTPPPALLPAGVPAPPPPTTAPRLWGLPSGQRPAARPGPAALPRERPPNATKTGGSGSGSVSKPAAAPALPEGREPPAALPGGAGAYLGAGLRRRHGRERRQGRREGRGGPARARDRRHDRHRGGSGALASVAMARAGAAGAASPAGRCGREAPPRSGVPGPGRAVPGGAVPAAAAAARGWRERLAGAVGAPARGEHGALALGLCRRRPAASCSAGAPASGRAPTSTPGGSWWRRSTSTRCECGPGTAPQPRARLRGEGAAPGGAGQGGTGGPHRGQAAAPSPLGRRRVRPSPEARGQGSPGAVPGPGQRREPARPALLGRRQRPAWSLEQPGPLPSTAVGRSTFHEVIFNVPSDPNQVVIM